jgi:hypothetical protein
VSEERLAFTFIVDDDADALLDVEAAVKGIEGCCRSEGGESLSPLTSTMLSRRLCAPLTRADGSWRAGSSCPAVLR